MTRRRRALFVLIVWAAPLVLVELGVRLTRAVPPSGDPSTDEEWGWVAAKLEGDQAADELATSPLFMHDPVTGWRPRPLVRMDGVSTNSAGMRTRVELPLARVPGRRRLLLVGDSYTWGDNVRDEETYGHVLATRHLPGWDVLNMGVPGTGTDQQLLTFVEHGRRWRPDVVVLGFFVRDYERNLLGFRGFAKPRFVADGAGLRLTGVPVPTPPELLAGYRSGAREVGRGVRSWALRAALGAWRKRGDERIGPDERGWLLLGRLMDRFASDVRAAGATPVWLLLPTRHSIQDGHAAEDALEELCAARAAALGMPYLSATPALRQAERDGTPMNMPRSAGGHYSPAGQAVVARELAAFLQRSGLAR